MARGRPGEGGRSAVERRAAPALYGPQAPQPAGPCAKEPLRRGQCRLHRHDLRQDGRGGGCQAQSLSAQMAAALPPVATSLEEAGEKLFTFLRFPDDQWKSIRTTNAIERLMRNSSAA